MIGSSPSTHFRKFLLLMACCLTLLIGNTQRASAGVASNQSGPIAGSDTSSLGSYGKPNQSRIWYNSHAGRWDGLIPKNDGNPTSPSDHYILTDVPGAQTFTAIELEDRNTAREDAFWDDAGQKLYVLGSHGSQTQFWRLGYDLSGDSYNLELGALGTGVVVPGIAHDNVNEPASLYVTPNGDIWIAVMNTGALTVQHSSDGGNSWLPTAVVLDTAVNLGLTTWVHFEHAGTTYAGLFAGENGEAMLVSRNFYWYIDQNADPTNPANWTDDSSNIPAPFGVERSDDHVAAALDPANNQYFAVKTEGGNPTDPVIKLFKRTPAGAWSQYKVTETQEFPEQTRPSLVLDAENGTISVYTTSRAPFPGSAFGEVGSRKTARLDELETLAAAPFVTIFGVEGADFNNIITPRDAVNTGSDVVVLAHNATDRTVWYNAEVIAPPTTVFATFSPVADAYVDQDKPNENKGDDDKLKLKAEPHKQRVSYLRFDVQGLAGDVVEATLYLYAKDNEPAGFDVYAVAENSWQEMGITYNNAPGLGPLIAHGSPTRDNKWVGVDVTPVVTGPGTFSLALVDNSDKLEFTSREASEDERPLLVVRLTSGLAMPAAVPNVYTLSPAADAYVKEEKPNENKGDDDKLKLKAEAGQQEIAYLQFDVPAVTGTVVEATLYLFGKEDTTTGIAVHAVAGAWEEDTITYANAPAIGPLVNRSGPSRNDRWQAIDVTAAVTGGGPVSLALLVQQDKNEFVSREGDEAPQLAIRTAVGPASPVSLPAAAYAFSPAADAYVKQEKPGENKGDDDKLKVKLKPGEDEVSYLRFDASGVGGNVERATLYLYARDESRTGFSLYAATDNNWGEYTINYGNAPATGALIGHSGAINDDQWIAVDLTRLAQEQDVFTLVLVSNGDKIEFESREADRQPLLIVTTGP